MGAERLEICRAAEHLFGGVFPFRNGAIVLPDSFDGFGELLVGLRMVAVDDVLFDRAEELVEDRRFEVWRAVAAEPVCG